VVKAGKFFRRVVPSPLPQRIVEGDAIETLIAQGHLIICTGGGGIPVTWDGQSLTGIEAVIDKDMSAAYLAKQIKADALLILTDADAVYLDWGKPTQRPLRVTSPDELAGVKFDAGSMGPKVEASCEFVKATGGGRHRFPGRWPGHPQGQAGTNIVATRTVNA
jgi:carbamate kinase